MIFDMLKRFMNRTDDATAEEEPEESGSEPSSPINSQPGPQVSRPDEWPGERIPRGNPNREAPQRRQQPLNVPQRRGAARQRQPYGAGQRPVNSMYASPPIHPNAMHAPSRPMRPQHPRSQAPVDPWGNPIPLSGRRQRPVMPIAQHGSPHGLPGTRQQNPFGVLHRRPRRPQQGPWL